MCAGQSVRPGADVEGGAAVHRVRSVRSYFVHVMVADVLAIPNEQEPSDGEH
jgi:hypothetical protein